MLAMLNLSRMNAFEEGVKEEAAGRKGRYGRGEGRKEEPESD
jgi:hypothetical protein